MSCSFTDQRAIWAQLHKYTAGDGTADVIMLSDDDGDHSTDEAIVAISVEGTDEEMVAVLDMGTDDILATSDKGTDDAILETDDAIVAILAKDDVADTMFDTGMGEVVADTEEVATDTIRDGTVADTMFVTGMGEVAADTILDTATTVLDMETDDEVVSEQTICDDHEMDHLKGIVSGRL